tara:strand:- start:1594 stop:1731 length:138 start_codon:yes stop_codon:yes gene_type:complete
MMFGMKFGYSPDRSRQEAIMDKVKERLKREALRELQEKEKKKNGS